MMQRNAAVVSRRPSMHVPRVAASVFGAGLRGLDELLDGAQLDLLGAEHDAIARCAP
jgi:hypothetical protein